MELIRHREIKKENIDINEVIVKSAELLTDEFRIQRINWDIDLEEALPKMFADGIQMQQAFMNIIINAIQALSKLPKGHERYLKISSRYDKILNQATVSFNDTGPGISEKDKQEIFEPFYSTKDKGAGIGLLLCKDLIAEHGGTITLESRPSQGANFIVKLPCAKQ